MVCAQDLLRKGQAKACVHPTELVRGVGDQEVRIRNNFLGSFVCFLFLFFLEKGQGHDHLRYRIGRESRQVKKSISEREKFYQSQSGKVGRLVG